MKVDDFVKEGIDYGVIIACGPRAYDVVWVGGSTTHYLHSVRDVKVIDRAEVDEHTRKHLLGEAADAKAERRRGARIRRGTVSPSR